MGGVAAVLLAAGESTRMGRPKALLPWQSLTLLESQLRSLQQAGIKDIVLVTGHRAAELKRIASKHKNVCTVYNPDYRQGKTTSIKAGIRALPGSPHSILILAVDQPRSASTIRALIEAHNKPNALISYPSYKGKGGHPILFSATLLHELLEITEETQGLKAVIRRHSQQVQKVELDASEVLLDINTPEDYERALLQKGTAT
jgi:molybdenum cofactor cytidylyltransferase